MNMVINILVKKFLKYIFYILFIPIWYLERLIPRDKKLWIFASVNDGRECGDNAYAFFEYILLNHPEINAVWLTKNKAVYEILCSKGLQVSMLYSLKGILTALRAKYYITDCDITDCNLYTRNGAIKINLWHGMPIKIIGYFRKKSNFQLLKSKLYYLLPFGYKEHETDLLIVTSDFFKPFLSSGFSNVFGKKFPIQKIVTTGSPRNDKLFNQTDQHLLTAYRKKYKNCRIIFYMPTFRLNPLKNDFKYENKTFFSPFTGFEFDQFIFKQFLDNENIVFLFKPHHQDVCLPDLSITDRFLHLKGTEYDDLYSFLGKVDILATDYSSVYFDFLLTHKPVVLTPFDYDDYVKMTGLFYDYNTYIFGVKAYNWKDFMRIITQREYYAIDNYTLFHAYQDDKSCERVFNTIIEKISF